MKLAIISSLFASAAAFAPANVGRASTQVSETKVRLINFLLYNIYDAIGTDLNVASLFPHV